MGYTLIIAEKPQAAERIAQALANGKPKKVEKRGIYYFEFIRNGKKHVCVPAVGHLFILDNVEKNEWNYPIFSYDWVPAYTKRGLHWTKKYFENIRELAKDADEFIGAADFDNEGEVLLFNILRFICKVKNAKRMKFSTLTKDELINSYNNLLPSISFPMLEAGLTRHELDWLWGINTTRALTLAMRRFANKGFQIISSGRVQSPTLALLLQRELEIRKFVPTPYWQLELHCKIGDNELIALHEKDKFWDKDEVEKILEECKGRNALIKNIERRKYKQNPPFPFNTTDLQAEAYSKFKFSPRQTLDIAESLYQQGFISYPRSASQKLPPDVGYEKILKALAALPEYKKLCEELLKKEKLVPNEGPKKDPAHPAIYATTEVPDLKKLTPQQRKLYDLIVRRTLATFADPALRETMTVTLTINNNNFLISGKRTIEPGWIMFYEPYVNFEEVILPDLKIGQILKVKELKLLEKETQPPARYSQGSIIKEMEKRGLGTRATRAEILQILYDRGYIHNKSIEVTKLGETVVEILNEYCPRILSEELTRYFEEEIEQVMNGKKRREEVIEEAKNVLREILEEFKNNEEKIGEKLNKAFMEFRRNERIIGSCPKCGKNLLIIRSKISGKQFVGCSSYKEGCDFSMPLPQFAQITPLHKACEECGMPMVQVNRKGKRPFTMCINIRCKTKENWNKNLKK